MSLSFLLCLAVGPSFAERLLSVCSIAVAAVVVFISQLLSSAVHSSALLWIKMLLLLSSVERGCASKKILKYIFCAVFHLMERIKCNHLTDRWQQFKSISTLSEYELGNLLFCYSFWGVCVCCFIITSETALIHTHRETFSLSKFPFLVAFSTRPSSFAYWKFPSIVLHATQAGFTVFAQETTTTTLRTGFATCRSPIPAK